MASAVLFLIDIETAADFAKASNFINKVSKRQKIEKEEAENICFTRKSFREVAEAGRDVCNFVLQERTEFQSIQGPEGIRNLSPSFQVVFIICVKEQHLTEIVQYQDLLLLLKCYQEQHIFSIVGGSTEFYFKLSQYLSFALEQFGFKDRCFYNEAGQKHVKQLQSRNLELSTAFLPLLIVDSQNVQRLKDRCRVHLGEKIMHALKISGLQIGKNLYETVHWMELGGIMKIFADNAAIFGKVSYQYLEEMFDKMDVLTAVLLAYSLKGIAKAEKKYPKNPQVIEEEELTVYVNMMRRYANACHQLMENITFHSDAGWGILSVRIHRSDEQSGNQYLMDSYGMSEAVGNFFEVSVRDFGGGSQQTDIAMNFKNHLDDGNRSLFENLKPEKLFRSSLENENDSEEWRQLHRDPAYIGKHFGLRIFQRILQENEGSFWAESHKEHICGKGDTFGFHVDRKVVKYGMPGTSYYIILPLKQLQKKIVKKDISQEYGDWLSVHPERLLTLSACRYDGEMTGNAVYASQDAKNRLIDDIAVKMENFMEDKTEEIFSADVSGKDEKYAEFWAKGIMIAEYAMTQKRHVVLYGCSLEFWNLFRITMAELYGAGVENMFLDDRFQIMLISGDYNQSVFVPGSIEETNGLNEYISRIKGLKCEVKILGRPDPGTLDSFAAKYIPFDVIVNSENGDTYFEQYVQEILYEDIQKERFGCQITNTHMRLGSTIHIDLFYEAELLFGSKYFVSRFALLMLRELHEVIFAEEKITLYGYGIYSESLLVGLRNAIRALNQKIDVDYIFLEREEERRSFSHNDKIRYSRIFRDDEERKKYISDRRYILIVPINSTLKTHQRLIDLLKEENGLIGEDWIIGNYALILVGTEGDNTYWKRIEGRRLQCKYEILPFPRYFVQVFTEYQEPLTCKKCFPKEPMEEYPLIEVNAASTIPNQAFGIVDDDYRVPDEGYLEGTEAIIKEESAKLDELKECLLYGHITRNDVHYLYYLQTEQLVRISEDKIRKSLAEWKSKAVMDNHGYHFIVAPMHYSNCGFVEMVNDIIFQGMAMVLRIDFNKDFRSNVYAKYSNIRHYLKQLDEIGTEVPVNFHYVDDSIITGRTFFRARSLIETIVDYHRTKFENVRIKIFDRIFILVDRNSRETRMQYLTQAVCNAQELDTHYFSYLRLEISSLRNYGDSCVICNLHQEAKLLRSMASTKIIADYWKNGDEKFGLLTLEEAVRRKEGGNDKGTKADYQARAYRRLFCCHVIKCILDQTDHGNRTGNIVRVILHILNVDYRFRVREMDKEEAFEYFVSYLKVCSRPFLAFQKEIKEAIYDILIVIMESIIKSENICDRFSRINKKYWDSDPIRREWQDLSEEILKKMSTCQKRDLVLVIMKQLTELKSNYLIRLANMEALFAFMRKARDNSADGGKEIEEFERRYIILVKRLTGVSSDTGKSLWLDYALLNQKELQESNVTYQLSKINPKFLEILKLENTRTFYDGIAKLYQKIKADKETRDRLDRYLDILCDKDYVNLCYLKLLESARKSGKIIGKTQLEKYLSENLSKSCCHSPGIIKQIFVQSKTDDEYWDFIIGGVRRDFEDDYGKKLLQVQQELGQSYEKYMDNYQYINFTKLWKNLELWGQGEEAVQISCALEIKYLCRRKRTPEEDMQEKVRKLVRLAGEMLNRSPMQAVIEYEDSSEFYLSVIKQKFDQQEQIENATGYSMNRLQPRIRKHYCFIAENTGYSEVMDELIDEKLNADEVISEMEKYGYYYNGDAFVWKLGENSKYPIFLFAKLTQDDKQMEYRIRNLLLFYNDLENYLFDKEKPDYLHELAITHNRLDVYGRPKSVSHTKEKALEDKFKWITTILSRQQKDAGDGEENCENKNDESGKKTGQDVVEKVNLIKYPYEILMLLADLNVSRAYRHSLTPQFYQDDRGIEDFKWKEEKNFFRNSAGIVENQLRDEERRLRIGIHNADSNQEALYVEVHNGNPFYRNDKAIGDEDAFLITRESRFELLSLLLSLILNVKENGRGIIKDNCIDVYLSRTERNTLRIANLNQNDEGILRRVKRCMEREPASEDSGITLWSLNSYLKRAKVSFVGKILENVKNEEQLERAREVIERLILPSPEYRIQADIEEIGDGCCFWYEIPLLWGKYQKELECLKAAGEGGGYNE